MLQESEDRYVGSWILGQYRIERLLASGGMGAVYLARQVSMERDAAVKILRPAGKSRSKRGRFRQEARAASRLTHPNIVTVYNFGELPDGALFLAMEYLEGENLAQQIDAGEPLAPLKAAEIARQCAAALGFAHSKHVIHRDFKPSNVIVSRLHGGDHVRVLDFGLARIMGETTVTQSGVLIGTPRYMTPEQWRCQTVTPRTDQYALGQVLWELLAGRQLVDTPWPVECMNRHLKEEPPCPSTLGEDPGLARLDPLVMRLLAKEPLERFEGMQQVEAALAQITSELRAQSAQPEEAASRPVVRRAAASTLDSSVLELREHPARVVLLGQEIIDELGSEELARYGLLLKGYHLNPVELATRRLEADLCVLGAPGHRWRQVCRQWSDAGVSLQKTLVCIETPQIRSELIEAVNLFPNLLLFEGGLDPLALAAALGWMRWDDCGGIELLWPDRAVITRQLSSSVHKSAYVDDLLEDTRGYGVRRRTLRAVAEVGEEMITSAFFWAPAEKEGDTRLSRVLGQDLKLARGREVALSWAFSSRHVGLATRDPFGALAPQTILEGISGTAEGRALGLRIMYQAAQHLFFGLSPGSWSEVMALVEREPSLATSRRHSLCILQGLGRGERFIGDRLRLDEIKDPELRHVTLRGEINETSDFRPIFRLTGRVFVDLAEVTRINSMGLQSWINAAREADDELELIFERCSTAVVSQLCMVPRFAQTGRVTSLHAPYYCERCDEESLLLLDAEVFADGIPPEHACDVCEAPLIFDARPEVFFAFLDHLRG